MKKISSIHLIFLCVLCAFLFNHIPLLGAELPDNVSNAHCFSDPEAVTFNMHEVARSEPVASAVTNPICGDIDGDGEIEILVMNTPDYWYSDAILVYGFDTGSSRLFLKYEINVPLNDNLTFSPLAIAKVDGNSYASVFYISSMYGTLTKYDFDGTDYTETWTVSYTRNGHYAVVSPTITDLMGNGRTQICLLDKVFDTKTGALLATGSFIADDGFLSFYSFGRFGHGNALQQVSASAFESMMVAVDIDDDGIKELIGGDCVYAVNLTNFDGEAGNSFTLKQRAQNTMHPEIGDGGTVIADIDNDGQLEVIISGPYGNNFNTTDGGMLYIYNPRTGEVIHENNVDAIPRDSRTFGPSRPFAGDVDGDGFPEVCLTGAYVLQTYKYNTATKTLDLQWELPTSDFSGSTTLTMFDFAQDGKARLVYRDQESLRIIDASTNPPTIEARVEEIYSPTVNEFPIVADINGDNAAEIIVTGSPYEDWNTWPPNWAGELRIYASAGKPWAPARSVWNQSAYNVLNVNEDLTIPANLISPATVFPGKDEELGTPDDVRPFNNFLQQQTLLNRNGNPLWVVPDYMLQNGWEIQVNEDRSATVRFCVKNIGNAAGKVPFGISLYKNRRNQANLLASRQYNVVPAVGEEVCYELTVSDFEKIEGVDNSEFVLAVNDNGKAEYVIPECDFTNNPKDVEEQDFPVARPDSIFICTGGSIEIDLAAKSKIPAGTTFTLLRNPVHGVWQDLGNNRMRYTGLPPYLPGILTDTLRFELRKGDFFSQANIVITIRPMPVVSVSPENSFLCIHDQPLELTATIIDSKITETDIAWDWFPSLPSHENTALYVPSHVTTDSVRVMATDLVTNCVSWGVFYITVQDSARITIAPDVPYICQDGEQEITLTAKVERGTPAGIVWYDGERTPVESDSTSVKWNVIPVDSASYWAYAVDSVCGNSPHAYTTVYVTNQVHLLLKVDTAEIQTGDTLTLTVTPTNGEHGTYRWYDAVTGNLLGETTENTFMYKPDREGDFIFYVLTGNGYCPEAASNEEKVFVTTDFVVIPNIITPYNRNRMNDTFMTPRAGRPGYKVEIYNRYQQKVFEGENGWDGTYRGRFADPGTYFYRLFMKDGRIFKGTVEVAKF